ncbi:MAG: aminotransferase class V-fold PLP-dependent enzyme [Holosporaceae bacterium]|jgi:cysteine desulfurase|nr:aminotransferase class V-fold PLP-dependent enzyme [Holosporaceae bacterium]
MKKFIYMDYQATTPCDPRVLDKMLPYFCEEFGNPHSSSHAMGMVAAEAVECARQQVASIIGVKDARSVIFTSGATESNNLSIQGAARAYGKKGDQIISTSIEHKCVLESVHAMSKEGFEAKIIPVQKNGIIDLDSLGKALEAPTVLVSVGWVNNEIGVCQPMAEISDICRQRGVLLHSDAAQAVGKIEIDAALVDLLSISGHKIYGPKGVGALYVRMDPALRLKPLFHGGGQERKMRSGTLSPPLCVGIGEACRIASEEMSAEYARLAEFKKYFLERIFASLGKVFLNGDAEKRIPGCLNLSFAGVEGESLMLGMRDVCISSGSACTSSTLEPSHVIQALAVYDDLAHSSLRIGMGRFTTFEEVKYVADKLIEVVTRMRAMSPIW